MFDSLEGADCLRLSAPAAGVAVVDAAFEFGDLVFHGILCKAVLLLENTGETIAFAADGRELVIGQLAPAFLDTAHEFFPVAFDLIPVHSASPSHLAV